MRESIVDTAKVDPRLRGDDVGAEGTFPISVIPANAGIQLKLITLQQQARKRCATSKRVTKDATRYLKDRLKAATRACSAKV
jgi:hypothetical protein